MRILLGILWGILLVLAALGLALGLLLATPQELAVVMGFGGFMLLASRLLWGYGAVMGFAESLQRGEVPDRSQAEAAARVAGADELSSEVLAGFWLAALEPYRYAFFAVYMLLFLIVLALKLAVPLVSVWSWITGSTLIEGVFWGASIAALIVWAFAATATAQVVDLTRKNVSAASS